MHYSNSTHSNYNPPFPENDINVCSISSKLQDPSSNNFMFNFPNSPHIHLEYEDAYNQFLEYLDQHKSIENQTAPAYNVTVNNNLNHEIAAVDEYQPPSTAAVRKRYCKKDRHSKINTARGPRDRRMRLSLEVARKFFDLQDLLGYDKASRTVDWLIKNSKPAIRQLERSNRGGGSCSFNMGATAHSGSISASSDGCEVVSSSNHSTTTTAAAGGPAVVEPQPQRAKPKRSKRIRVARATVERESRRRARERARERTSQKRRLSINEITNQPKIFSKSLTESPMQASTEFEDLNSDETQVSTLLYSATWNQTAILDNYQNNAGIISNQIADEFDCGKAWEAYNTALNLSG